MSQETHNASLAGVSELRTAIEATWRQALQSVKDAAIQALVDLVVAPPPVDCEDAICDSETDDETAAGKHDDDDEVVEPERERGRTRRGKRAGRRHRRRSGELDSPEDSDMTGVETP